MFPERHVRMFRNGRNQAVRIPREFELDAQEAIIQKEDDRLVLEPVRKQGLLAALAALPTLEEEFLPDADAGLLPLDVPADKTYAQLRWTLEQSGRRIDPNDC